jgi:hypothetical protein
MYICEVFFAKMLAMHSKGKITSSYPNLKILDKGRKD